MTIAISHFRFKCLCVSSLAFVITLIPCFPVSGYADSVEIPKEIREQLERNASDLDPITLVWTVQKQLPSDVNNLANFLETPHDYGMVEKKSWVFMWQGSKGYSSDSSRNTISAPSESGKGLPFVSDRNIEKILSIQERSFDGEIFCAGHRLEKENTVPGLGVYPLRYFQDNPMKNTFYQRYTIRLGYKFPSIGRELGTPGQSYILFLCENGKLLETADVITENGKKLFYVEARGYDPWEQIERNTGFWLDPDYNYAVILSEVKSIDGKLAYSVKNENFDKLPGKEVYLPKNTSVQYFTDVTIPDRISATPLFTEEFVLTEVSTKNIPDDEFDLRSKFTAPGTLIGDRTLTDTEFGVQYRVPANPADLDRVIEAARTGGTFTPTPIGAPGWVVVIRWMTCIAGILMLLWAAHRIFLKIINR